MSSSGMDLMIGIPCYGDFKSGMVISLFNALPKFTEYGVNVLMLEVNRGTYLHLLREQILNSAVSREASHLLFIDSDMSFPPESVQKLIELEKDIVGGNYSTRTSPHCSTVKILGPDGNTFIDFKGENIPKEPFKCGAVGTGFMLIRLGSIINSSMEKPYFDISWDKNERLIGEDINFCIKARKAGLEVWCDPTIKLGHIGEYTY